MAMALTEQISISDILLSLVEMSDYQDYSWRVALGDTETELPDLSYITYSNQEDTAMDIEENSTFDVAVCGNLTDNYKRVTMKFLVESTNTSLSSFEISTISLVLIFARLFSLY